MKSHMRETLRQIPLREVAGILLAGVLISAGIVMFRHHEPMTMPLEESEKVMYELDFLGPGGELLEQQKIAAGKFAVPPELESVNDGVAFRGWNRNLYGINRSMEVSPVYQNLRYEKNAFYIDAKYAQLGETVEVELWLNGLVTLSSIELVLVYDPDVLSEVVCEVENSPFIVTAMEQGKMTIKLDDEQNLMQPITVAVLRFKANEDREDIARTTIRIEMNEPRKMTDGGEVGTDCCAIHGEIYLLS